MMKAKMTTIAINLEGKWCIDTYARIGTDLNDKKFVENFNKDYDGNGIIDVKILESVDLDYFFGNTTDYITIMNEIENRLDDLDGNHTILNY